MAATAGASTNVNDESTESVLGRGTRVRGRVRGEGHLRVEGAVEGDVAVSGELSVEEGGTINGNVQADSVTVGGEVSGDVTARGPIVVRSTARVAGHVAGSEVSLDEGASFEGTIDAQFDLPAELR